MCLYVNHNCSEFEVLSVLQECTMNLKIIFIFRTVFIADLVDGRLETTKSLTVRFSEFEASVMGITSKINDALDQEDSIVLTDGQGNQILDTEGTRGKLIFKKINIYTSMVLTKLPLFSEKLYTFYVLLNQLFSFQDQHFGNKMHGKFVPWRKEICSSYKGAKRGDWGM